MKEFKPIVYTGSAGRAHAMLKSDVLPKKYTLIKISEEAGLPLSWLRQFSSNRAKNPDSHKIDLLLDYLKKI